MYRTYTGNCLKHLCGDFNINPSDGGKKKRLGRQISPQVTFPRVLRRNCWKYMRIASNKTLDLVGIRSKVLKVVVKAKFDLFDIISEAYLHEGIFPTQWKNQKSVSFSKVRKSSGNQASYRLFLRWILWAEGWRESYTTDCLPIQSRHFTFDVIQRVHVFNSSKWDKITGIFGDIGVPS